MKSTLRRAFLAGVLLASVAMNAHTEASVSPVGIVDTMGPDLTDLAVQPGYATSGDLITITLSATEPLRAWPEVSVNGHSASFVSVSGGTFTYQYAVLMSQHSGEAAVTAVGIDMLGNAGALTSTSLLFLNMPSLPVHGGPVVLVLLVVALLLFHRRRAARIALLLMLLLWVPVAGAQEGTVSNISFMQQARPQGGTEIVITYDLDAPGEPCTIQIDLSKDGGADGFMFPVKALTGDVVNIRTGTGYKIIWDVAKDYPGQYISQAQFRLTPVSAYLPWREPLPLWRASYLAACQNNLKQSGFLFRQFTESSDGKRYPQLSSEAGQLMLTRDEVCSSWDSKFDILRCPSRADGLDGDPFEAGHHVYLGYMVLDDDDVTAFASAYRDVIAEGGDFSEDLPGASSYPFIKDRLFRLRKGVEGYLITDINDPYANYQSAAQIPVMFDWPDNHFTGFGGNVLYLDGHVEFKSYPDEFPMTEATIATLAELTGYEPPQVWTTPDFDGPYTAKNDPHGFAAECGYHLARVGIVCRMQSNEVAGPKAFWPQLSPEYGRLMMTEESLYPEYLFDRELLYCPGKTLPETPAYFEDRDYVYWGYTLLDDADVLAFADAYATEIANGGDFSGDLSGPSSYGDTLLRLYDHVADEIPWACDSPELKIPIMLEWPFNHEGRTGGNVLYLDGHREWHDYPGEFPMTVETIFTLENLAGREPTTAYAEPDPTYIPANDPYGLRAACRHQLKQVALALKMYSNQSRGERLPSLSRDPGRLMFDMESGVYPEFFQDSDLLICPGPEAMSPHPYIDDQHYAYIGHLLTNDADVSAFADAYSRVIASGGSFDRDLPGTTSYGDTIYQLREGVHRFLFDETANHAEITVAEGKIPVLIEWPDNHEGSPGGHVLYLDGHVEWHDYPGEFPMTEATITTLRNLADPPPTTAYYVPDFYSAHDPHHQWLCGQNLRSLAVGPKLYSSEAKGEFFPPLSATPGNLIFNLQGTTAYYEDHLERFNCPGSAHAFGPPHIGDQSYVYLGYLAMTEGDVQAFAMAYPQILAEPRDIPAKVSYGSGNTLIRLRDGIERYTMTNINGPDPGVVYRHEIPVLIEWPDNHGEIRGGNVAYMDGHVEWLDYPGDFPMTEGAMAILTELAGRPPIGEK